MGTTVRDALRQLLAQGPHTLRDLSGAVHQSESEVADHLQHLERTLKREKRRILIEPAQCLSCEFRFDDRRRFTRPGKCPKCRSTRLSYPSFEIQ